MRDPSPAPSKSAHPAKYTPKEGDLPNTEIFASPLKRCSHRPARSLYLLIPKLSFACLITSLLFFSTRFNLSAFASWLPAGPFSPRPSSALSYGSSSPPLSVFQIREPVPTPSTQPSAKDQGHIANAYKPRNQQGACILTQTLMVHSFAWSYDHPYVGIYEPPGCDFNQVTINFTVLSKGRQFDRLGFLFLNDVEIFRTSTAEPTWDGIQWTYLKDMSHLLALFKKPQKIIFDLGNLIDDTYTAPFNATLTATFFKADQVSNQAHSIIPISARRATSNKSSPFRIPADTARDTIVFPRNVRRAVVSLSACGQADEEFWFGNVYQSDRWAFPKISPMLGYSPFREVQLLIDGELAGVVWPFPVIFTGGVVPGLWRPLVGLDAFDLREQEIDITPWLALLCDGDPKGHTFEIRVVGIEDDGKGHGRLSQTVGNNWPVTGKIFLWLDPPGSITTGALFHADTDQPFLSLTSSFSQNSSGENTTIQYQTQVNRYLMVNSMIWDGDAYVHEKWTQALVYSSFVNFTNTGGVQLIEQLTKGVDKSSSGYEKSYHYPIRCNTSFNLDPESGNFTIDAPIDRELEIRTFGPAVFPTGLESFSSDGKFKGSLLWTRQNGSAHYLGVPSKHAAYGHGSTDQKFDYFGLAEEKQGPAGAKAWQSLYSRDVKASNGKITRDIETRLSNVTRDESLSESALSQITSAENLETAFAEPRGVFGRWTRMGWDGSAGHDDVL